MKYERVVFNKHKMSKIRRLDLSQKYLFASLSFMPLTKQSSAKMKEYMVYYSDFETTVAIQRLNNLQ